MKDSVIYHYSKASCASNLPGVAEFTPNASGVDSCLCSDPDISSLLMHPLLAASGRVPALIHYCDPFLLRANPLRGLKSWIGPKILACGDLHHGPAPLETLAAYLEEEPHDAVLLTFNPSMLGLARRILPVPVRCLPPTFFRYPAAQRALKPKPALLHVGSLGPYHPRRRDLVLALQQRARIPIVHTTTSTPEQAAELYAQHALVLNVPLNNDLNHRFFEVMAAGAPQVVFGDAGLVGEHRELALRPDVFWAKTIDELENLVLGLLAEPEALNIIPVEPPPYWEIKELLKAALAP